MNIKFLKPTNVLLAITSSPRKFNSLAIPYCGKNISQCPD